MILKGNTRQGHEGVNGLSGGKHCFGLFPQCLPGVTNLREGAFRWSSGWRRGRSREQRPGYKGSLEKNLRFLWFKWLHIRKPDNMPTYPYHWSTLICACVLSIKPDGLTDTWEVFVFLLSLSGSTSTSKNVYLCSLHIFTFIYFYFILV